MITRPWQAVGGRRSGSPTARWAGVWLGVVAFTGYAIAYRPFPESLAIAVLAAMVGLTMHDLRWGIGLWYALAGTTNRSVLDFPGLPPLHTAHAGLLVLLAMWLISTPGAGAALAAFFGARKNQLLLVLLGWITVSMIAGRITGITQMGVEYQINAWLAITLAVLGSGLFAGITDRSSLTSLLRFIVLVGTVQTAVTLAIGLQQGVRFFEPEALLLEQYAAAPAFVGLSPLFIVPFFFAGQPRIWRFVFAAGFGLAAVMAAIAIISGSRALALAVVSAAAALAFFARPRLWIWVSVAAALTILAWGRPALQDWMARQTELVVTEGGALVGPGSRVGLARDALEVIALNPLWGTGTDLYRTHAGVRIVVRGSFEYAPSVHNTWLQAAADHGIPAAVLLAAFTILLLRDAFRLRRSADDHLMRAYALFFLVLLSSRLVVSWISSGAILPVFTGTTVDETAGFAPIFLEFWLFYGLLIGIERLRNRQEGTVS